MMKNRIAMVAAALLCGSLLLVAGTAKSAPAVPAPTATPEGPSVTLPQATVIPNFTYGAVDAIVTVPDSKLKAALHAATGIAAAAPLHKSELAKLAGGLDLSGKSIANADGLQWCVNLTGLNLSNNKLTALPKALNQLTLLDTLILDENKFTKVPDVLISMPKLTKLTMKGNALAKLPENIYSMPALTTLDVSDNKLKEVPAKLGKLLKLKSLSLAKNQLTAVPKELFKMPVLESMDLSENWIETIPAEAAQAPKLVVLNLTENTISKLPAGIGNAPALTSLLAARNRLSEIDASLLGGKVKTLTLDTNRLTTLPDALKGKAFDTLTLDWNYLDMAEGSAARTIAESVTAATKNFEQQLQPIVPAQSIATTSTVALSWGPLASGTAGDSSWKVKKFYVYQVTGESWKSIAQLDSLATQYVVVNLKADKAYQFMLGVEYELKTPGVTTGTRLFAPVDIKTLKDDAASAAVTGSVAPTLKPTVVPSATASAAATVKASSAPTHAASTGGGGASSGLIITLIVISSIAAIALVGVLILMLMNNSKQRR